VVGLFCLVRRERKTVDEANFGETFFGVWVGQHPARSPGPQNRRLAIKRVDLSQKLSLNGTTLI
jgi:hypothetical protein